MSEESTKQPATIRTEDFAAKYANQFEIRGNLWDLTLRLGQIVQEGQELRTEEHTAITLPWAKVKLLAWFLQVQIAEYEYDAGRIGIPGRELPMPPSAVMDQITDPIARKLAEELDAKYRQYFGLAAAEPVTQGRAKPLLT